MAKARYYVVWKGRRTGIFTSWPECERQVSGFVGAEYKAFESLEQAKTAFQGSYSGYRARPSSLGKWRHTGGGPRLPSLCVDAACSGSPGRLEYRGVKTETGQQVFRAGPFAQGTNNVGEFLAIVDALRWLRIHGLDMPVYSDSETAMTWVRGMKCNSKLHRTSANAKLFKMIAQAEHELRQPQVWAPVDRPASTRRVLKWDTAMWGENPADFGRK